MNTKELINIIFKDPTVRYELTEFETIKIDYKNVLEWVEHAIH